MKLWELIEMLKRQDMHENVIIQTPWPWASLPNPKLGDSPDLLEFEPVAIKREAGAGEIVIACVERD